MDLPPVPCFGQLLPRRVPCCEGPETHVATGEVTTLEHELGDDTVELGAGVAEALLARAESAEVLGRLGDNIVEELEVDATDLVCKAVLAIDLTSIVKMKHASVAVAAMQVCYGQTRSNVPLSAPLEVMSPLLFTWTSGPYQETSK
jgi:hypothetical protein